VRWCLRARELAVGELVARRPRIPAAELVGPRPRRVVRLQWAFGAGSVAVLAATGWLWWHAIDVVVVRDGTDGLGPDPARYKWIDRQVPYHGPQATYVSRHPTWILNETSRVLTVQTIG